MFERIIAVFFVFGPAIDFERPRTAAIDRILVVKVHAAPLRFALKGVPNSGRSREPRVKNCQRDHVIYASDELYNDVVVLT